MAVVALAGLTTSARQYPLLELRLAMVDDTVEPKRYPA